ncbi:hypothetical protein BH10PLA2_BH10PLA2_17560 [soil metagenome]
MSDLITNARARLALPTANATPGGPDDNTINALISACSKQIEKYCRRTFGSTAHDELYSGTANRLLMLRHFPILSVQSVRCRPSSVLRLRNNDSAINQKARVWIDAANLYCQETASAVVTLHTSAFASYATLAALATHINSTLASFGWEALVAPGYELWPTTDLYPPIQGAQNACGVFGALCLHAEELAGFHIDPSRGYLMRSIASFDSDRASPNEGTWPRGLLNFRVQYTAGFATVPEDVQEACAQMVAAGFRLDAREIASTSIPHSVAVLLAPWRSRTITSLGA